MKVRNGFVSNSSSSSFCILGIKKSMETYAYLVGGSYQLAEDAMMFREDAVCEVHEKLNSIISDIKIDGLDVLVVGKPDQTVSYAIGFADWELKEAELGENEGKEIISKALSEAFDVNIPPETIDWHEITYHT